MESAESPARRQTAAAPQQQLDVHAAGSPAAALERAVRNAADALLREQAGDGHWCYELEADCTIPAEYLLLMHFTGEVDERRQSRLANYLRRQQAAAGGWPLYHGGDSELSCSVKTYYALKLAGDTPDQPHMARARDWILAQGGAARANVFTRITLAMFQQVPWRATPYMPPEIMLLPRWFPFHVTKVSYWSRTVMVPLFILYAYKPVAANPGGVDVRELFTRAPEQERRYFEIRSPLNLVFLWLERVARVIAEPLIPGVVRRRALQRTESWVLERLNGEDGLGGIYPAMANAYMALRLRGYDPEQPPCATARRALRNLVVERNDEAYCQPCVSPVWDTGLACLALEPVAELPGARDAIRRGLAWLRERQILDEPGDWRATHPDLPGGGWAFQYANPHYPDLDDTAMVGWAMDAAVNNEHCSEAIRRAARWLAGMQSKNGGFAAFDSDNTCYYLNAIPFADHGALLDPPTADVSARVLAFLGRLRDRQDYGAAVERCLQYLRTQQEPCGAWFGRWGTNYIYGTWSVLTALEQAGVDMSQDWIRAAVAWLFDVQREDGSWGESNRTYEDAATPGCADHGSACHTAWALLALQAAGEGRSDQVAAGVDWLLRHQDNDGLWSDPWFNAPGFPRVFYLKYHGYSRYFPLWALARYWSDGNAAG